MCALEISVVGESVMRNRSVRPERRDLHVAEVAALPLDCLAL